MSFLKSKKFTVSYTAVLALLLVLCSFDKAKALSYDASIIDPFTYKTQIQNLPNIELALDVLGITPPPGRLDINSLALLERGYYKSMYGWSDSSNWNNTYFFKFLIT